MVVLKQINKSGAFDKQVSDLLAENEKRSEIIKLKKALACGEIEDAMILLKYSNHVLADDINTLFEEFKKREKITINKQEMETFLERAYKFLNTKASTGLNDRLSYKDQLLNELELLKQNSREFEISKVKLSDNDPFLKLINKYLE